MQPTKSCCLVKFIILILIYLKQYLLNIHLNYIKYFQYPTWRISTPVKAGDTLLMVFLLWMLCLKNTVQLTIRSCEEKCLSQMMRTMFISLQIILLTSNRNQPMKSLFQKQTNTPPISASKKCHAWRFLMWKCSILLYKSNIIHVNIEHAYIENGY